MNNEHPIDEYTENYIVDSYKSGVIWRGYNDSNNHSYYFVTDEDGNDCGLTFNTINEAKQEIDNW